MILRIFCVSATLLLAGCSDLPSLDSLLTFKDDGDAQTFGAAAPTDPGVVMAAAPAPAPADDWCKNAAANARNRASADGFDAATQDRLAAQIYRQCTAFSVQN